MNGGSGDKYPRVEYTNTKYRLEAVSCEGRVARDGRVGGGGPHPRSILPTATE